MEIQICGEEVKIVRICPRLDSATSPEVELAVKGVLEKGATKILFDFSGTEYVSSLGLRVVLSTAKTIVKSGGKFAVFAVGPAVRNVFDMAGFGSVISILESEKDAMEKVK